jgi:hypothetical protein
MITYFVAGLILALIFRSPRSILTWPLEVLGFLLLWSFVGFLWLSDRVVALMLYSAVSSDNNNTNQLEEKLYE